MGGGTPMHTKLYSNVGAIRAMLTNVIWTFTGNTYYRSMAVWRLISALATEGGREQGHTQFRPTRAVYRVVVWKTGYALGRALVSSST